MRKATDCVDESQRSRIQTAVAQAESKTSCEVVPVVATASGRYDRAEDIIGLWLAVVVAVTVWLIVPNQSNDTGNWQTLPLFVGVLAMIVGVVLAFLVGVVLGSRIGPLRRLFTPRQQMLDEVAARARGVFFDRRVHHTEEATGLLIYVSLYERMAVILGDQQVLEKLGQPALDQLCGQLTENLRTGNVADALCGVITEAGTLLSDPLPRAEGDIDELKNTLVLLD